MLCRHLHANCIESLVSADVEAAAHFDHWQRAHLDDQNVRQDLWPEALRNARVIPAVEYIQVRKLAVIPIFITCYQYMFPVHVNSTCYQYLLSV